MFELPNTYQPNLILTNSNIQGRLLSFCLFLARLHSLWNLSSLARDRAHAFCSGRSAES